MCTIRYNQEWMNELMKKKKIIYTFFQYIRNKNKKKNLNEQIFFWAFFFIHFDSSFLLQLKLFFFLLYVKYFGSKLWINSIHFQCFFYFFNLVKENIDFHFFFLFLSVLEICIRENFELNDLENLFIGDAESLL